MEMMGLLEGVYVVENRVGLTVPVGVKLQTGTINFIAVLTVSVRMLFIVIISSFETAKRWATLSSVSPS